MFEKLLNWARNLGAPEAPTESVTAAAPLRAEPAEQPAASSLPAVQAESVTAPAAPKTERRGGHNKKWSSPAEGLRHWRAEQKMKAIAAAEVAKQTAALAAIEAEAVAAEAAIENTASLLVPKLARLDLPGGTPVETLVAAEPETHTAPEPAAEPAMPHPMGVSATFIAPAVVQPPVDWAAEELVVDAHGFPMPIRYADRIAFLIPMEVEESKRRGLPPDPVTGASAMTMRRISNNSDRIARHNMGRYSLDAGWFVVRPGSDGKQKVW